MKTKQILKIGSLGIIMTICCSLSLSADDDYTDKIYYEYEYTESVTIKCGEKITLDPTQLDGEAGTYFRWYRNHPSSEKGHSYCGAGIKDKLEVTKEYEILTPAGNGDYVDCYKCDVIGLTPGTYTFPLVWFTESKWYNFSGTTTGYVYVRCNYRITVQATDNPKLQLSVSDTCYRVVKGTNIRITSNNPDASIYYSPNKNGSFWSGTYPNTGITLNEIGTKNISARAIKLDYPASDLFDHDYKVIEPGDFHEMLPNGADVHFNIISEQDKTCKIYFVPDTLHGEFTIPSKVNGYTITGIGSEAFYNCKITSINIPESISSLESTAFGSCDNLTSVNIPQSITKIPNHLFVGCNNLTEFVIPEGTTEIGTSAFKLCTNLRSITIPQTVTTIKDLAFLGCPNIQSVISYIEEPTKLEYNVFSTEAVKYSDRYHDWPSATLYVPKGCKEKYSTTGGWMLFKEIVEMESTALSGDVNEDGEVNGTDLVSITNIILGKNAEKASADVNDDGFVNGTDYVALTNIILGKEKSVKRFTPPHKVGNQNVTTGLSIESFDIKAGETKDMFINLTNPGDEITLVQFDLQLPNELSVKKTDGEYDIDMCERTSWRKHSLDANATNGKIRFLLSSSSNTLISGNEGSIIKVTLTANSTFDGGTISLDNILMVSPDEIETRQDTYTYNIGPQAPVIEDNYLSIEDFNIKVGETKDMVIYLTNPNDEITLVQFDLRLPNGLSVKQTDGEYDIDMCERTSWRKHSLDANETNGIIRFLLASSSNTLISGTEGGIIKIALTSDNTFVGGTIKIENILLVSPDESEQIQGTYEYYLDETDGINGISEKYNVLTNIYNLSGLRVKHPLKGVYIQNGKKMFVK